MAHLNVPAAHLNLPIPGVMIEQGMLGKNGAVRPITPGNEVELEAIQPLAAMKPRITPKCTIQPGKWQQRDQFKGMQLFISNIY